MYRRNDSTSPSSPLFSRRKEATISRSLLVEITRRSTNQFYETNGTLRSARCRQFNQLFRPEFDSNGDLIERSVRSKRVASSIYPSAHLQLEFESRLGDYR